MCNCDAEYAEDEAAGLRAELAAVTAERDALLAGKWAGPWEWSRAHQAYVRPRAQGGVAGEVFKDGGWTMEKTHGTAISVAAAKDIIDARLRADGCFLAGVTPAIPKDGG